ncbi:MAG: CHAT domain-containing protein [Ktedonobacteraceae bacterium]
MDLQAVVMTTFVLLEAEWPLTKGRELIEMLQPTHVILHQSEPQESYYLYTLQETLDRLEHAAPTLSIQVAFDLYNAIAPPLVEIHTNAENAPDWCIVHDEGRLVGFFDASVSPGVIRTHRGEVGKPELERLTSQSLIAEFPEQVELNELTSLLVSLSSEEGAGISVQALPTGTTVDIIVQVRGGFVLEGRGEGSLTIADAKESLPLQFKLRSTALGPGQIRVLAFHDGIALGKMVLAPMVVPQSTYMHPVSPSSNAQPLAPVSVQLPDLTLFIEETWVNNRRAFTLRISASNPSYGLNLAKFGPIIFQTDPGPYFQEFYQDIEDYPIATSMDRAIAAQKLVAKGDVLFSTLFPPELRSKLWVLKDQITSVLVQSEEPWIPWELCKLCGEENGRLVAGPFFCEAFTITRWLPGLSFKPKLTLQNMAVVVPSDSGLPCAFSELEYLLSLAQSGRRVKRIPAKFLDVYNALASGEYDGWHFTGHGGYRASDPNRSAIYLENRETFKPEQLVGVVTNLGASRPLVFLDACQIGRSGMSLTDIGGWAKQFLFAGAGAFIGPYWSVYDQPACDFAKELYKRLLVGLSIGKAVQEARLAIKATGDPTWLAYTVFADPFARADGSLSS